MKQIIISNSLRNKATGCKKAFWFNHFEGLVPKFTPEYFTLGGLWHELMERLFRIQGTKSAVALVTKFSGDEDFPMRETEALLEEKRLKYISSAQTQEELDKTTEMFSLLAGMLSTYKRTQWQKEKQWRVVAVEYPFRLALGPKISLLTDSDEPRNNEFVGIIDLIVQDPQTGHYWPVERKTTRSTSADQFENELRYDYQPVGYLVATELLLNSWYPGEENIVVGVEYSVARKSVPKLPEVNQCKQCKGKGIRVVKVPIPGTKTTGEANEVCALCDGTGRGQISLRDMDNTSAEAFLQVESANPQINKPEYSEWYTTEYLPFKHRVLNKARPFHWSFQHVITKDIRAAWLRDTLTVAQSIRAMHKLKPEQFTRSLDKHGDCPTCLYRDLCFDDSPELRAALFTTRDTSLPIEVSNRKEVEAKTTVDLDWL